MTKTNLIFRALLGPCIFAMLLATASCHKERTVPGTAWPSISPEVDNIVARLEAGYVGDYDSMTFHTLIDSLKLLARGNKLPPPN